MLERQIDKMQQAFDNKESRQQPKNIRDKQSSKRQSPVEQVMVSLTDDQVMPFIDQKSYGAQMGEEPIFSGEAIKELKILESQYLQPGRDREPQLQKHILQT